MANFELHACGAPRWWYLQQQRWGTATAAAAPWPPRGQDIELTLGNRQTAAGGSESGCACSQAAPLHNMAAKLLLAHASRSGTQAALRGAGGSNHNHNAPSAAAATTQSGTARQCGPLQEGQAAWTTHAVVEHGTRSESGPDLGWQHAGFGVSTGSGDPHRVLKPCLTRSTASALTRCRSPGALFTARSTRQRSFVMLSDRANAPHTCGRGQTT